jgi:hypothetical protein
MTATSPSPNRSLKAVPACGSPESARLSRADYNDVLVQARKLRAFLRNEFRLRIGNGLPAFEQRKRCIVRPSPPMA